MNIETRINRIEKALGQNYDTLYQKPCFYLIEPKAGEADEQAQRRYEQEHNLRIADRDLVVMLTGDE